MTSVPEFRVIYRRDGRQKKYRIFQLRGNATRLLNDLKKDTRGDLTPIVELDFETRECGAWYPVPTCESEPAT